MRLNIDSDDKNGYANYASVYKTIGIDKEIVVYCDGVRVKRPTMADEEAGEVKYIDHCTAEGEAVLSTMTGKVEIKIEKKADDQD